MRAILCALLLTLLAAAAFAAPLPDEVTKLAVDVDARIAALGAPPATREAAAEQKQLVKAKAKLALYRGENDLADFKALAAAGKALVASHTTDAAVTADATAVINAICDLATTREGLAEDVQALLTDPRNVATVDRAINAAEAILGDAKAVLATNPVKAQALAVKAWTKFGKAGAKAEKLLVAEAGGPLPSGLSVQSTPLSLFLINSGTHAYDIAKVRVFLTISSAGSTVRTIDGRDAKELIPTLFSAPYANRIYAAYVDPGGFSHPTYFGILQDIVAQLIPEGSTSPAIVGKLQVTFRGRSTYTVVPVALQYP
jgi:hypothetical protein